MNRYLRSGTLALLMALAAFGGGAYLYWRWCVQPLPIAKAVDVEIAPGESLHQVAHVFADKDVLLHAWDLVAYARLHEASAGLRAGEYRIEPGTTVAGLLALLRSGRVVLHSLTLVEGWNLKDTLAAVQGDPDLKHTLAGVSGRALVQQLGFDAASAEGMLLPDTYQFPKGTSDAAFLHRAALAAQQNLDAAWKNRTAGLPYKTPYEALIMASIVEKETAQPAERGLIAGVFVRRLEKGMKLQTDPTVIYGLGDAYDGLITYKDLRTDTPYNTYTRYGLPPTPICMPSRASIEAALHPTPGKALYFVARGDGTHEFSDTLVEQNAAVQKYQIRRQQP
ncbi:MAG TPA: endolytic transglycosylase MltG [Gammaproteobacteria bacterium]|nr:endolytic transglycosylase MltG [Gammaproteobacteria bacterium]